MIFIIDYIKDIKKIKKFFIDNFKSDIFFDELLKNHTSFRIGGPADIFFVPRKVIDIIKAIDFCLKNNIRFFVMGNGTNLLVSDLGFRGVIIKISNNLSHVKINGNQIEASSGIFLSRLSKIALENNLSGLEFASGIPGTFGGAISMNAGAYGCEIKDIFVSAKVLHNNQIKELSNLKFGYRKSLIDKDYIVLSAKIKLIYSDKDKIYQKMLEYNKKRRDTQPLNFPNAGSIFKRPKNNFAGKLIQEAGLSGYMIGGACVSEKHCGFIINKNNATAKDVLDLINFIRQRVKDKFNIELEPEIKFLS